MYFIYTAIFTVGVMAALPYYLVRFRKYLPTAPDRLGFLRIPPLRRSIWVHAVSVGEVKAVQKLLERLRDQFPASPIVLSTVTPAGRQVAQMQPKLADFTFYFPLDLPWAVHRTIERVDPELVIIAETEIWPNFLRACRRRGVRVLMVNGRISDRSLPRYRWIRRWLRQVFADYTVIGVQSELDRQRIESLGADPRKVAVLGNLKYDAPAAGRTADPALENFLRDWKPLWIAASTMPGEEELVLAAYAEVLQRHPRLKLMIAPRHAGRFDAVAQAVERAGFDLTRRTGIPARRGGVLLLDTIGELAGLLQHADIVFVGGSLAPAGGHNPIEPARHGKPIVFGPHMENFREIERQFVEMAAAVQIQTAAQLAPAVADILSNPGRGAELGRNALAIVRQNTGVTERVLEFIEPAEVRR